MGHQILTERELEEVFYDGKSRRKSSKWLKNLGFFFIFISLSAVFYGLLNFRSIKQNFLYWYATVYQNGPGSEDALNKAFDKKTINNGPSIPQIENNSINVPAINIKAPITWQVPNTPDDVKNGLENGLIQIKDTALPGEIGNVFITGHSSNYPWANGDYNNVLALLNKLVVGDYVQVRYEQKDYVYKVSEIKVVSPDDLSVLNSGDDSILTLMTCTPVGTSINRLIVTSKQLYPDPNTNIPKSTKLKTFKLPPVR